MNFWASVIFDAKGGRVTNFLQKSAENNLKLRDVKYILGGVSGKCDANKYEKLSEIAVKYNVELILKQKLGLYFKLKPIFMRTGIWLACVIFLFFWLWSQNFVWYIYFTGATEAQIARIRQILWQSNQISTGTYITPELLEQGKQALLNWDNEFSWVSLNFNAGRLVVEVTPAKEVPIIKEGYDTDLIASQSGTIVYVNVEQGTPLVKVGQEVAKGQVLVSASRLEHDQETLVFSQTSAEIHARFIWQGQIEQSLKVQQNTPVGVLQTNSKIYIMNKLISLPWQADIDVRQGGVSVRNYQPSILGIGLPATIIETNYVQMQALTQEYTKEMALYLARESCNQQLFEQYPYAQLLQVREKYTIVNNKLIYEFAYEVVADIVISEN